MMRNGSTEYPNFPLGILRVYFILYGGWELRQNLVKCVVTGKKIQGIKYLRDFIRDFPSTNPGAGIDLPYGHTLRDAKEMYEMFESVVLKHKNLIDSTDFYIQSLMNISVNTLTNEPKFAGDPVDPWADPYAEPLAPWEQALVDSYQGDDEPPF